MPGGWLLAHTVDCWPVIVGASIALIQVTACRFGAWWFVPIVILLGRWSHLAEHNLAHLPVFRWRWLDEAYGGVLSISTGTPLLLYWAQHVATHHRFENGPCDWTSPYNVGGRWNPRQSEGLVRYALRFGPRSWKRGAQLLLHDEGKRLSFVVAVVAMLGVAFAVAGFSLARAGLYFGLPWITLYLASAVVNWMHHDGCEFGDRYAGSNVNLRWYSRTAGFNIGYHSAHHAYPELHWSELPAVFAAEFRAVTPAARVRG